MTGHVAAIPRLRDRHILVRGRAGKAIPQSRDRRYGMADVTAPRGVSADHRYGINDSGSRYKHNTRRETHWAGQNQPPNRFIQANGTD
ncbi:MAG: hypothetical protein ACYDA9_05645 [Terriglobia bacterium]